MTRDEAVDLIAARLGNRGDTFDAQIVTEMQTAQIKMEELPELPWFLLYNDTSLTTAANTKTLALPSGFLLEDDFSEMFVIASDGSYHKVKKGDYSTLRGSAFFNSASRPERFALQGSTLYFFPTPDAAYSLEWFYYKADTTLSAGSTENAWLTYAPGVLIAQTGIQLARYLRDPAGVSIFNAEYNEAIARMWTRHEARRQAALDAFLGG